MTTEGDQRKQELRGRTKEFAGRVVVLFSGLPLSREEVRVIGRQLLRSATSVAANYREASRARTSADFISKIETCAQEADESQLWLELLKEDCGIRRAAIDELWTEADELIAIFVTMSRNAKRKRSN